MSNQSTTDICLKKKNLQRQYNWLPNVFFVSLDIPSGYSYVWQYAEVLLKKSLYFTCKCNSYNWAHSGMLNNSSDYIKLLSSQTI